MFGRENVYAMVHGFNVRVKDEREQDKNHLVEVTFEVPLTHELMDEISPEIARDLFNEIKGDYQAKPELNGVDLNLSPETQLMTVRNHPELDADVKIAGVTIRKIRAKKAEAGTWLLAFTCTWTLGEPKEAVTMIQRLKQGVYLTFAVQEPKLDLQDQPANVVDGEVTEAQVEPGGNVTAISTKRRGRKKNQPEAEAEAQAEEAARKALPGPSEDTGDEAGEPQQPADPIH